MVAERSRGRILFTSRDISRGGTSRVTLDLIRFLQERGFEAAYAVSRANADPEVEVPCDVLAPRQSRVVRRLIHGVPALGDALFARWFRAVVRRFDPSVLYGVTLSPQIMRAMKQQRRPCVEHVHAMHLDSFTGGQEPLRLLASCADHYVCSSRCMAERLEYCVGIPRDKVEVLYHGVDVAELERRAAAGADRWRQLLAVRPGEILVGGIGIVDYIKGIDRFVEIVNELRRALPTGLPVRFLWAGGARLELNQYWRGVQALLRDSGLEGTIEFIDYLDDVAPFLGLLDVVVIPSRAESLPLLLLEALALGRPVASFPVGGIPEVLAHGGGLMSRGEVPAELAAIVAQLVQEPQQRALLAVAGPDNVRRNFLAGDRYRAYPKMLDRVVAGHAAGAGA